jgi:sodium pump decarboxylase gamma subunit
LSPIAQGLEVSLLGIVITFLALGIFILIMVVLKRLFPAADQEIKAQVVEAAPAAEEAIVESADGEGEIIAAIAAALAISRSRQQRSLGDSLLDGRGGWWTVHRIDSRLGKVQKRN